MLHELKHFLNQISKKRTEIPCCKATGYLGSFHNTKYSQSKKTVLCFKANYSKIILVIVTVPFIVRQANTEKSFNQLLPVKWKQRIQITFPAQNRIHNKR